jgi:flagellar motor switch protein FliN/FliY
MTNLVEDRKLNIVLDVKVQVTVRLGSCELPMRDVLELGPGAIIQLNQRANDPVGLYVNDKLIARGEVVVLEESFGIKITELVGDRS